MNIIIYKNNFDKKIKNLKNYQKIYIENEDIIKLLNEKELNNINLLFHKILKINIEKKLLLIKVTNYNKVIELKNFLIKKYNVKIDIINDNTFIEEHILLKKIIEESQNIIVSEKIENITEDAENFFKKLLKINIDNIYCITHKEEKNVMLKINNLLSKFNISYQVIKSYSDEQMKKDMIKLHKYCINDAKQKKYNNIIIMTSDTEYLYKNFNYFLRNKDFVLPTDYDIVFLSGKIFDGEIYSQNILKVKTMQDTTNYILNKNCYEYILNNIDKEWGEIEEWNKRSEIEKQINWNKKDINNFYSKHLCQKRNKSYMLTPLISYKETKIDKDNRIINYKEIMEKLCNNFRKKYHKNFNVFILMNLTNVEIENKEQIEELKMKISNNIENFNIYKNDDYNYYNNDNMLLKMFNLYPLKENKIIHKYDKNEMNNFLNNFYIIEYLSKQNENKYTLIINNSNDFEINEKFNIEINNILKKDLENEIDVILLEYENYNKEKKDKIKDNLIEITRRKENNKIKHETYNAYLITNKACKKIIQYIKNHNIQEVFSNFMIDLIPILKTYKINSNIIRFEKIKKKENLLDDINKINKLLNPNMEEKQDNNNIIEKTEIKDERISNIEKYKELIKDSNYKEIIINDKTLFMNSNKILFEITNDIILFYGSIDEHRKIKIDHISKNNFSIGVNKLENNKENILFYLKNNQIPEYLRKIIELCSLKYNVYVILDDTYNIIINNVYYLSNGKEKKLIGNIIEYMNIKKVYTNTMNILLLINKNNIELNYLCMEIDLFENINQKLYKNNGIEFMRNTIEIYDNIFFYNNNLMNEFKDTLNLIEIPKNFQLNSYILEKNNKKNKLGMKEKIIISIDKHPKRVLNAFKLINKKLENEFKLVLLNNNILEIEDENVIVEKYNEKKYIEYLDKSFFFITFENEKNTHYNILKSINHYCIPIISKYFSEYNNKFITFVNFINKHNLDDIKELYTNEKKYIIYNNMCDIIIKNHLKNIKY